MEKDKKPGQSVEKLKKGDFIEIRFTGTVKDTEEIFDSNREEELEKISNQDKPEAKPLVYCLGEGMFLEGVDDYLVGISLDKKKHRIELTPDKAFGKRDSELIKRVPVKVFREHNLNPVRGGMFNFDGKMGRVLSVSGGRILVDFNHPLAGKDIVYDVEVKRKVENTKEKINAFNDLILRKKDLKYEIKNNKVIYENPNDQRFSQFLEMFKPKFKEIFGMDLEIKGQNKGTQTNQKKASQEKDSTKKKSSK